MGGSGSTRSGTSSESWRALAFAEPPHRCISADSLGSALGRTPSGRERTYCRAAASAYGARQSGRLASTRHNGRISASPPYERMFVQGSD
jgi:hypothetical protein